jgi:hypothetical protein
MSDLPIESRCRDCRSLLGEQRDDRPFLRLQASPFAVVGKPAAVVAACGKRLSADEASRLPGPMQDKGRAR